MKVLLLEKHNVPGGFATSFVRGRFEFEPSLHELGTIGTNDNKGCVLELFNSLGVEVEWCEVPELFVLNLNNKSYVFPHDKEGFAKKMDEYEPGSYHEVIRFIDICFELYDAALFATAKKAKLKHENEKNIFLIF